MWLLLVNTVKSTGQWYFPGERAQGRGRVREGAGVERGQGGHRGGVGVWGQRKGAGTPWQQAWGGPPQGLPRPLLREQELHPVQDSPGVSPSPPSHPLPWGPACFPTCLLPLRPVSPAHPTTAPLRPCPVLTLRRPSLPRCPPTPGEPVQVSLHRTLQQGGHVEMRDLELYEL